MLVINALRSNELELKYNKAIQTSNLVEVIQVFDIIRKILIIVLLCILYIEWMVLVSRTEEYLISELVL